jgi:hypothetical protein
MLLIIAALVTLIAVVLISRAGVPGAANAAQLGWMSERWLAEYRASNPPQVP